MRKSEIEYILSRIVKNAKATLVESEKNDAFQKGRKFAYHEILDTIKNELIVREQNLEEYGLDIDLEEAFL